MSTKTRVVIEGDRRLLIAEALRAAGAEVVEEAANSAREFVRAEMASNGDLSNDTGALYESMTVQTRNGSDEEERRQAAKARYLNGPSFWREIVQEVLTEFAYTEEHFEQRAAQLEELPADAIAAVGTFMAYGFWWQMGHFNLLTERWEQRSWFIDPITRWAISNMQAAGADFESRVIQHTGGF